MRRDFINQTAEKPPLLSRRDLIVGGTAAGALFVGWSLWPRVHAPNLAAAPGETILNGYIKIGKDGHIVVVSPQIELGQGSYTHIAQIVADEMGADWRTIGVEPAPVNGLYANSLLSAEWKSGLLPATPLQGTGSSSTIRAFAEPVRDAAAGARILLSMAAADRWNVSWEACETDEGFIILGKDRIRFGDLADAAAGFSLPDVLPRRVGGVRLAGRGVNRLDIPAKIDGSANYAADIRLPDMLFAAIRQGPPGDSKLLGFDKQAALKMPGVFSIVDHERWVAVAANNWWAANKALDAAKPKFETAGLALTNASIVKALDEALKADGKVMLDQGDAQSVLDAGKPITRIYRAGLAPHAALEPMAATASFEKGQLQLWIATQVPDLARIAAAQAADLNPDQVILHAMQVGGSFGRKYEVEIAAQVALLALKLDRPVQLVWSRAEDHAQDRMRPPAAAKLSARFASGGRIEALSIDIATPDGLAEVTRRNRDGYHPAKAQEKAVGTSSARTVDGAVPPYGIPSLHIRHHPTDIGLPVGKMRGGMDGVNAFFVECFIDELAAEARRDPFSFRIGLLAGNPRLAQCLTRVTARGGWEGGGQGTSQGIACHSMQGSHIAVMAEAIMGEDGRAKVRKLIAVADIGRVLNPDIARQQIEGGLLFGMGLATGTGIEMKGRYPEPRRLGALGLPLLADMPEISVELIRSKEAPGGLGELAVSPVAPAIANAIFAGSGQRLRNLPLGQK
jgi:isoquinoline 1-oxidoreductase subunit beta